MLLFEIMLRTYRETTDLLVERLIRDFFKNHSRLVKNSDSKIWIAKIRKKYLFNIKFDKTEFEFSCPKFLFVRNGLKIKSIFVFN